MLVAGEENKREMLCGDSRNRKFGSCLSLWFLESGPFGYCIKDEDDDDGVLLVQGKYLNVK